MTSQPSDQDASFLAAIRAAARPGYLGDLAVVSQLLRALGSECAERWATVAEGRLTSREAIAADLDAAGRLAMGVMGRAPAFPPGPINNPPKLAAHIRHQMHGAPDVGDEGVCGWAAGEFLAGVHRALSLEAEGRSAWARDTVDEVVDTFTRLFTGLPIDPTAEEEKATAASGP